MTDNINYVELYEKLYTYYGLQSWWPAASDLQMLISAILVQRTNWKNVEMALRNLGENPVLASLVSTI